MTLKIGKIFYFEAAHTLPNHLGACKNMHGHSYKLEIEIEGDIRIDPKHPDNGMIMDYGKLKKIVNTLVIDRLDHSYLNDIFPNPTAENMVEYIATVLAAQFNPYKARLSKVILWETRTSYVEWTPTHYDEQR